MPSTVQTVDELRSAIDAADDAASRCRLLLALARRLDQERAPEAVDEAERALRLARRLGEPAIVADAHLVLGQILANAGATEEARARFESAVATAERAGAMSIAIHAQRGLGFVRVLCADYAGAARHFAHALVLAEESADEMLVAMLSNSLGTALFKVGDFTGALPLQHRAADLYERLGASMPHAGALNNIGNTVLDLDDAARALEYYDQALALSRSIGDVRGEIRAGSNRVNALGRLGRLDDAVRQCREVISLAESIGSETDLAIAFGQLGYILQELGRSDEALRYAERSAAAAEANGMAELLHTTMVMAGAMRGLGDMTGAKETLERVLVTAVERGERGTELSALAALATIHDELGLTDTAFELHKRHAAIAAEITGAEQQRRMMAIELQKEIEIARREREQMRGEAERLRAEMERANAELAGMALRLAERSQFIGDLGEQLAGVSTTADDGVRATVRSLARRAREAADRTTDWREFEQRFAQVHPQFGRALLDRCAKLSKTEMRVGALLKLGLSSKEIAEILATSERTIEWHRSNLRAKLDLPKDASLATYLAAL